ncbi:MAG: NAD-dependent epimerase/dehydratase family protein [Aquabacterium sp.]|nr:NAD-dependent epimerase/dehydratase family protein [Aquabacterium sp.]
MTARKVLVLGALGMVGRAAMQRFAGRSGLQAVGLARRAADFAPDAIWLQADLRDAGAARAALAPHRDVTHVVYAALNEQPNLVQGWRSADNMALNTRMLANTLDALDGPGGGQLQHITLLQGTKAYGVHTGRAMPVPAREHDALRDHVNFYFDQQDLVADRAARAGFAWTIFRPQIVLGLAVGSAMNPVAALGAYAVLCRERGLPLTYPGHPHLLTECTDARLIAEAIEWAWGAPQAHGEAFNISNGDVILWPTLFPRMAAHFGMALGEPAPQRLRDTMPPLAGLWQQIAQRDGLRVADLDALIGLSWQYADTNFAAQRPLAVPPIVSTIKLRQAGFASCIDTEACILQHLQAMQAQGYLPA